MKKWQLNGRKVLIFSGVFLFGVPAAAFFGNAFYIGAFMGSLPSNYYANEPCFPTTIATSLNAGGTQREIRVSPRGVLEDGFTNTFLRCSDFADENRMVCTAGFSDGTVAICSDREGPHTLPDLDDRVYMVMDATPTSNVDNCEIVVEKTYGEANPACRPSTTAPVRNSNGSTAVCNDQNAVATLTAGQTATVPTNACVKLVQDRNWSSVNPMLQAQPQDFSVYPVPFTATSCGTPGFSVGASTVDWEERWLIDNSNAPSDFREVSLKCDVYVKFGGNGSKNFKFTYYD